MSNRFSALKRSYQTLTFSEKYISRGGSEDTSPAINMRVSGGHLDRSFPGITIPFSIMIVDAFARGTGDSIFV